MSSEKKDQISIFDAICNFIKPVQKNPVQKNVDRYVLYIDGASRGNPGKAGVGIFFKKNEQPFLKKGFFVGVRTNNEAEYLALLLGLYLFKTEIKDVHALHVISDSQLLIRQMQGVYKVKKDELRILHSIASFQLEGIAATFEHVEREKNSIADELANKGIDEKIMVPLKFLDMLSTYGFYI